MSKGVKQMLTCIFGFLAAYIGFMSFLAVLLWLLRDPPKLPRATPLITATDIAPEDR